MKIDWNSKYTTIAVYAVLSVCSIMIFYLSISNIDIVLNKLSGAIGIMEPFIIGFSIALSIYYKDQNSKTVGWVLSITSEIIYFITLLSSEVKTTFIFAFPLAVLLILYRNRKLIAFQSITMLLIILIYVLKQSRIELSSDLMVMLGGSLLFIPCVIYASKFLRMLTNQVIATVYEVEEHLYKN